MTSMRVFREFIKRIPHKDGSESVDATDVISRECYDLWISTRKTLPPNPEKAFQRSLSAHVTGVDGRVPFTPQEEDAVLKVLRRKERWPCFEQSSTRFGLMGFRAKGFHEKSSESGGGDHSRKRMKQDDATDSSSEDNEPSGVRFVARSNLTSDLTTITPQFGGFGANFGANLFSLANAAQSVVKKDDYSMPAYLHDVNITQTDGNFSFLETAGALLNRFYGVGLDAWGTILSIGRMLLVSKGWSKPPTMEDAKRLLKEYQERYPGQSVLVMDPTTRLLKERVMALNAAAQAYLGPVARTQNGLDHRLIPLTDAWAALTAVFGASKTPGVDFAASINIVCADGALRPIIAWFCMHPDERLLIVRAIPRIG
jgi:hypothetical protein